VTTLTLVDSEATARTWAKAETHINAAVSGRVFFSTPQSYGKTPADSWIVLSLVGETHQAGDLGLQLSLVQFDCWGKTKALAAAAALAVQTAARQISSGQPMTVGSAVITWADLNQRRWLPDPTTNTARYVVDVQFAMHGAEQ
jgi:hypothetical protein